MTNYQNMAENLTNPNTNPVTDWLYGRMNQPHPITQLMPSAFDIAKQGLAGLEWGGNAFGQAAQGNQVDPGPALWNVMNIYGLGGPGSGLTAGGAKAAPWFSALARAIESAPLKSAPPEQWLGTIKNTPGVKPEELDWSKVPEWLGGQQGPVTKEQLLEHAKANQVDVQEVVKGGSPNYRTQQIDGEWYGVRDTPRGPHAVTDPYPNSAEAQDALDNGMFDSEVATGDTKFSQWQMPGGENYKELMLTMPPKNAAPLTELPEGYDLIHNAGGNQRNSHPWGEWGIVPPGQNHAGGLTGRYYPTQEEATKAALAHLNSREVQGFHVPGAHAYGDPASDVNRLAHIRFNDRVDAEGKKTLHIEEAQSDAATKLREAAKAKATEEGLVKGTPEFTKRAAYLRENPKEMGIDWQMPFVHDPNKWTELVLKRMVKYAADNGYDQITWTPGKVQAERYDLSKQLDRVTALDKGDGVWSIQGHVNNLPVLTKNNIPEAELADVVGKDLADKIIGKKGNIVSGNGNLRAYSGLDLQIGGEGMKGYYDKLFGSSANKLFNKKQYGFAKVGVTKIPATKKVDVDRRGPNTYYREEPGHEEVWSLPITDAMRKEVGEKGMPLFSGGKGGSLAAILTQALQSPDKKRK